MSATKRKSVHSNPGSPVGLFLTTANCWVSFQDEETASLQPGIFVFAQLVKAESAQNAKLIAQQCILREILDRNTLYSDIRFDEVEATEFFQEDLIEMKKIARKRPREDS